MGGKDDGAARFQGDHRLVAHGGGGVGAGDDGRDDPHGDADFPQLFLRDFPENPHGFHPPDGLGHIPGGKEILFGLILGVSEARLPDGHVRQHGRLFGEGLGHRFHDGVQLALGHFRKRPLGNFRLPRQFPRLLPRGQILIKFHRNLLIAASRR